MSSEIEKNLRETTHRVLSGTFAGITQDSREVKPGYIFAALQGTKVDGHDFIPQALEKGATGIIAKTGREILEDIHANRRVRVYRFTVNLTRRVEGKGGAWLRTGGLQRAG